MGHFMILAQTAEESGKAGASTEFVPLNFFWEQVTNLTWLQAIVAISFGLVYMLYGWRIFKILVIICFGMLGLFVGMKIGDSLDKQLICSIIGLSLLAAVSIPLMRWAVSILGAVAGGILTGGLWYAFGLPEKYIIAGAIIGIIAGGMISFIVFRIAIMLFTSLGGGGLIITGLFALLHLHGPTSSFIHDMCFGPKWFLPVALLVPTAIGIIVQNKLARTGMKKSRSSERGRSSAY